MRRNHLCIDIDNDMPPTQLQLARLLYEYNHIKRKIIKTKHGYHVYLLGIPIPNNKETLITLYKRYGDDPRRGELDYIRYGFMTVNVCFTTSEQMEVSDINLDSEMLLMPSIATHIYIKRKQKRIKRITSKTKAIMRKLRHQYIEKEKRSIPHLSTLL